jgi:hypothetical protein
MADIERNANAVSSTKKGTRVFSIFSIATDGRDFESDFYWASVVGHTQCHVICYLPKKPDGSTTSKARSLFGILCIVLPKSQQKWLTMTQDPGNNPSEAMQKELTER